MLLSKLSRLGVGIIKELSGRKFTAFCSSGIILRPYGHYWQPQFEFHREAKAFHSATFQKHHQFSSTAAGSDDADASTEKQEISVTFVDKDGDEYNIKVPIGMSMLEAAHQNDIELEGACEGSIACSTCHVIVTDVDYYNRLEDPTDEENDMLDLAFGLAETSRLGCQVIAKPELDGIRLAIPAATRNFAVDGYVPKPH
uniref:Adrenodoxin-like ferredoxin 2 family protein n=3 Tax=Rhizophora mucronata TaxID=61149 RepID=A0A2P2K7H0_RHIMU